MKCQRFRRAKVGTSGRSLRQTWRLSTVVRAVDAGTGPAQPRAPASASRLEQGQIEEYRQTGIERPVCQWTPRPHAAVPPSRFGMARHPSLCSGSVFVSELPDTKKESKQTQRVREEHGFPRPGKQLFFFFPSPDNWLNEKEGAR